MSEHEKLTYAVLDTRNGGVDGYYTNRETAERAVIYWKQKLGHDDVICCWTSEPASPISNECMLPFRILKRTSGQTQTRTSTDESIG